MYIGSKPADVPVGSESIEDGSILYADLELALQARFGSQGQISGDRNRVINGSCQIVNVASVVSSSTPQYGGPELFRFAESAAAGGQVTQSQGSLTWEGITLPTVRQTVDTPPTSIASANFWTGIEHLFEGFNVFDLRGKPVAVSFVFNTNLSGTYSVALRDGPLGQSYVTTITAVANTPMQVTIPISAIPLAASVPNSNALGLILSIGLLNTGTLQTATLNAWQAGNFCAASGATNWGATAGNFIELTNLQLEEGTVATPFIRRSYQQELALTQRYYWRVTAPNGSGDRFGSGQCVSTTATQIIISFPVAMRNAPASMDQSGTAGDYVVTTVSSTATLSAPPAFVQSTQYAAGVTATVASGLTGGNATQLRAANTNAYLGFSARL